MRRLNDYFRNIVTNPTYNITSPLLCNDNTSDLQLCNNLSFNEYYVLTQMAKITKTSPGPNNIPHWFCKNCSLHLAHVVPLLFNKIIQTSTFLTRWKLAILTPIPKVSQPKVFSDFGIFLLHVSYPVFRTFACQNTHSSYPP